VCIELVYSSETGIVNHGWYDVGEGSGRVKLDTFRPPYISWKK